MDFHSVLMCKLSCSVRVTSVRWPQSRHADVFGGHEMVCRNLDKLTRHNSIVRALIIGSGLAGLSARLSNVLEMRRRLPDGREDPSD
jgi:hypothetical protein